jgi:predicted aldo/keto reductase-like oxidoreductase
MPFNCMAWGGCKLCEDECPQYIPIREQFKVVRAALIGEKE